MPWPFQDPENTAAITLRQVFSGAPIIRVYHDWYNGGWQFLPDLPAREEDAMLVCLHEIYEKDHSVGEVANLPHGWLASRSTPDAPWVMEKNHPFPVFSEDRFYLDDAEAYENTFPDQYSIPPADIRENLPVGSFVKLIFRFAAEDAERQDNESERMWVEVIEKDEENYIYKAELRNDPALHSAIAYGHELWFHPCHVFEV